MKIVHLAENMEVGGAEKLISLLCRWQREQGHEPSVHCLYGVGVLGEDLRSQGFEVVLHSVSSLGGLPASVYRGLKDSRPDVVHCHNANAAIIGAVPARAAGVKRIIVTRHGVVAPPYLWRREIKFGFVSRWCNWIVAVCDQARRNLIAAPLAARQKIVRIYNGAEIPHRNGTEAPKKSGFTLLHVGRLSPAKDQETLLRAFALAKTKVSDLRLWIVGNGRLRSTLESLAKQIGIAASVTFFGEQSDVSTFLFTADLFILSSVTEGLPVSLIEALASGLPSIVTEVGGMVEVSRLSEATKSVPPSDPAALAIAIEKMAMMRSQLARLKTLARECHAANFTLQRMASEYMSLYTRDC